MRFNCELWELFGSYESNLAVMGSYLGVMRFIDSYEIYFGVMGVIWQL